MLLGLKRVVRSGIVSFGRNGVVSLASVLVFTVALFIIGSLMLGEAIIESSISELESKVDITVYFKQDAKEDSIAQIKNLLEKLPEVREVSYTSRDAALDVFKKRHADNSLIINSLEEIGENPLGGSLQIAARDPSEYEVIAKFLERRGTLAAGGNGPDFSSIDKVNFSEHRLVIERLNRMIDGAERFGGMVAVAMVVISILVAVNTIRLAIYTSREEIAIMKLVGASNNYVRGPFIVEGILYGLISGGLSLLLMYVLTLWFGKSTEHFFGSINIFTYYTDNMAGFAGVLMGAGVLLGAFASAIAIRRYLKV